MVGMNNILLFSLIAMRVSGFILFNPILGRQNIPAVVKTGIILALSFIIISYEPNETVAAENTVEYALLLIKELGCGFAIGIVMNMFLYVIILSGEVMDLQIGLSMSKIYDAQSNISLSLTATFFNLLFVLLFFTSNAHLALIRLFINSGDIVPYGSIVFDKVLSSAVLTIFCDCTVLAIKFAMPIIAAEILAEIGVGIMMKAIPQIDVFSVNIQAKVLLGIALLFIMFTPMSEFIENLIELMFQRVQEVLSLMV